jgi:hypothetical protein
VFFLAPGPLTFTPFAHGFGQGSLTWLVAVLAGTGVAALRGRLPGVEPRRPDLAWKEKTRLTVSIRKKPCRCGPGPGWERKYLEYSSITQKQC